MVKPLALALALLPALALAQPVADSPITSIAPCGASNNITWSTPGANRLVCIFVTQLIVGAGGISVSGGATSWSLVAQHADSSPGNYSSIYCSYESAQVTSAVTTVSFTNGSCGNASVISFSNADTTAGNSASGEADATITLTVTPAASNSLIYGTGGYWWNTCTPTHGSNDTRDRLLNTTNGDSDWVWHDTVATTAGVGHTISATCGSSLGSNYMSGAAVEIKQSTGGGGGPDLGTSTGNMRGHW